jgi:hypothetical protein
MLSSTTKLVPTICLHVHFVRSKSKYQASSSSASFVVLVFWFWTPSIKFVNAFVVFKAIGVIGYFQVRHVVFYHLIPTVITHRFLD